MNANDFRRLALALPETAEQAHMEHPDFRVGGKIFATLGYPAKGWGMVKLTPEQQHYYAKDYPDAFVPVKGAWGRRGATSVHLTAVSKESLQKPSRLHGATRPRNVSRKNFPKKFRKHCLSIYQ